MLLVDCQIEARFQNASSSDDAMKAPDARHAAFRRAFHDPHQRSEPYHLAFV